MVMCAVASEYLSLWIPNFHWKFWFPALLTYASSGLVWTSGYMGILPSDNQSRREVPVPFAPPAAFSIISSDCFDISDSFWTPPWRHHPGRHNVSRQTSTQLSRKMLTGPCLGENRSVLQSLNTFDSLYAEIPLDGQSVFIVCVFSDVQRGSCGDAVCLKGSWQAAKKIAVTA